MDRDQLSILNGIATTQWKKKPTQIMTPTNGMPPGLVNNSDRKQLVVAHKSGTNPYGQNPNSKNVSQQRVIGNPTSCRVLQHSSSGSVSRPRKKTKTEHTSGPYTQHMPNTRSKRNHEVPLAPETIDSDGSWDGIRGDNSHTNIISSPDELNALSLHPKEAHSSKYQFHTPTHGSSARKDNPPIAADGKNTEWAKKKFSNDLSDNISNRGPRVGAEVAKIEAKSHQEDVPKRIDLNKVKAKYRMKNRGQKLFPPGQPSRDQPSQASAKRRILPLKELYLDHQYYKDGLLEISWDQYDNKLSVKHEKSIIFGPCDIRRDGGSLTYHDDGPVIHDPIFKLTTRGKYKDERCLIVRLDCDAPDAQASYYRGLLNWLTTRIDKTESIRASARESLWESVARAADCVPETLTRKGNSGKSMRLDELREGDSQRAKRSLFNAREKHTAPLKRPASQSSLRFTPPIPSSTVPDNQKSRQDDLSESVIPRRSTRSTSGITRSQAIDSDEVILVYPPGVPGAVNITNGDLHRLQPDEFLNDTLIEFGLKLWLKDLEQTDPILASQIHVFNSFFYKKLTHHKKGSNLGGYESVRKWTSKFDIFQKKYIIVPINEHLHWYLAIIYEPEHVLVPAVSNIPSTRQQTRQSLSELMVIEEPSKIPNASKPVSTSVSENGRDEDKLRTPSEAEVEHTLNDFKGSCSISNIEPGEKVEDKRSPSALSYLSDKSLCRMSLTASDRERALLRRSPSPSDEKMAMDLTDDFPTNSRNANHNDDLEMRSVNAASFYHVPPKRDKGKRKADPESESVIVGIDDDDDGGGRSALSDTPKTYIFTFDSLGGPHPQAVKNLSAYLKMEAQDKKNIVNAATAVGKPALVPEQPNFCDCGIYVLHLAQTFMSNPAYYRRMILTQKSKSVDTSKRKAAWHDHQVTDKRKELMTRIKWLSDEWKKERAAKEEAKEKEALNGRTFEVVPSSSDSEIDILEPTPSTSKAKSDGKRKAGRAAKR